MMMIASAQNKSIIKWVSHITAQECSQECNFMSDDNFVASWH